MFLPDSYPLTLHNTFHNKFEWLMPMGEAVHHVYIYGTWTQA